MRELYIAYKKLQTEIELYHWMYSKYDLHNILGEFQDSFYELIDDLVESDININGNFEVENLNLNTSKDMDFDYVGGAKVRCLEELDRFHLKLVEYQVNIEVGKEVLNTIVDDIFRLLNKTAYKIKMT